MTTEKRRGETEVMQGTAHDALFLSGSLALDLVNTELAVRGKTLDVLSSPVELAQWWQKALAHYPEHEHVEGEEQAIDWTPALLARMKEFRQALRTLCTHLVEEHSVKAEDLAVLNQMLSLGHQSLQTNTQGEIRVVYCVHDHQQGALFLPIALSAFRLLTEAERARLHKCKNERCSLFFYDTTKSGTRQWCSLGCMNRARSISHYHQQKQKVNA